MATMLHPPGPSAATLTIPDNLPGTAPLPPTLGRGWPHLPSLALVGIKVQGPMNMRPTCERSLGASCPHVLSPTSYSFASTRDSSIDRGYMSVDELCHTFTRISEIWKIGIHSPWGTKFGDRIIAIVYGALLCGAPALEEFRPCFRSTTFGRLWPR